LKPEHKGLTCWVKVKSGFSLLQVIRQLFKLAAIMVIIIRARQGRLSMEWPSGASEFAALHLLKLP